MSTTMMSQCWPLSMPPVAKSTLISLADNANDSGHCWPSIPTICARTCYSRRAVINAIAWLESAGALAANRTDGRHTTYTVTPLKYCYKPVHDVHPCTSCTSAPGAKPVHDVHKPVHDVHPNRKNRHIKQPSKAGNHEKLVLPDWLPSESWDQWYKYRNSSKGWTPFARKLSLGKLSRLYAAGHDPTTVIEQSIELGWTGLFPVKPEVTHGNNQSGRRESVAERVARFGREGDAREAARDAAACKTVIDAQVLGPNGGNLRLPLD